MSERIAELQELIDQLKCAIKAEAQSSGDAGRVSQSIFSALDRSVGTAGKTEPIRLAACSHFGLALNNARQGPPLINRIADILKAIEPKLTWRHPSVLKKPVDNTYENIANAIMIGPNGLEQRSDVMVGMTIMGPHTVYPNHQHIPEEIYTIMSAGEWRQNEGHWHEPGLGGLVYNPSNIIHAFRSSDTPLLAIWCLLRTNRRD